MKAAHIMDDTKNTARRLAVTRKHRWRRCVKMGVRMLLLANAVSSLAQAPFRTNLERDINQPGVVLTWESEPGGFYDVLTAGLLQPPWRPLNSVPLLSPLNQVILRTPLAPTNQVFQIVKTDTVPPLTWGILPTDRGIAVTRRGTITVTLYDDGILDTNTISIAITNGPPVRLDDPRLSLVDGVLTYTPGPGDALGDFGQIVNVSLSAADISGNRLEDFSWSFQIEPAPIPRANVVVVSNAPPGLVLVSTNAAGNTLTFSFTGPGSGLAPGVIVVSADPAFSYRRSIVSAAEDGDAHLVVVVTTQATVSSALQQGSVQFEEDLGAASFQLTAGQGFRPAGGGNPCCTLNFDGQSLLSAPDLTAQVLRGRISLKPQVGLRGNFGPEGLLAADFDLNEQIALDLLVQTKATAAGGWTNRISLGSWRQRLPLDLAGVVPASAEARLELTLGFEGHFARAGAIEFGLISTNLLAVESKLRNGSWTNLPTRIFRYRVPTPAWATNLDATVHAYVEVRLAVTFDGEPGPVLELRPGVEAVGATFAPPGEAGFDLFLYDNLAAEITTSARGWDSSAPESAPGSLLPARSILFHQSRTEPAAPVDPPVRPLAGMAWIPPGKANLGRDAIPLPPGACDCPQTEVTLTNGYYMSRFEVTQREFLEVMTNNPAFHHGGIWGTNLDRPVESITWFDATNYCSRLTVRERLAGRIPYHWAYRLPFEAEWEYACRAGTTNAFHSGDRLRPGFANFDCRLSAIEPCTESPVLTVIAPSTSSNAQPVRVGQFAPNAWGLHDLHGNVHEWCLDWLGDSLPGGGVIEPRGDTNAPVRAYRGGSFSDDSPACRSSARAALEPTQARTNLGMRVVLAPGPQDVETYRLVIRPGFNFIANQLERGGNTLGEVIPFATVETRLFVWNPQDQSYRESVFDGTMWIAGDTGDPSTATLAPGSGAFLHWPEAGPGELMFTGLRCLAITPPILVPGTNVVSRQTPQAGNFQTIVGRPPTEGIQVLRFDPTSQSYITATFENGAWLPSPPAARIGEPWIVIPPP